MSFPPAVPPVPPYGYPATGGGMGYGAMPVTASAAGSVSAIYGYGANASGGSQFGGASGTSNSYFAWFNSGGGMDRYQQFFGASGAAGGGHSTSPSGIYGYGAPQTPPGQPGGVGAGQNNPSLRSFGAQAPVAAVLDLKALTQLDFNGDGTAETVYVANADNAAKGIKAGDILMSADPKFNSAYYGDPRFSSYLSTQDKNSDGAIDAFINDGSKSYYRISRSANIAPLMAGLGADATYIPIFSQDVTGDDVKEVVYSRIAADGTDSLVVVAEYPASGELTEKQKAIKAFVEASAAGSVDPDQQLMYRGFKMSVANSKQENGRTIVYLQSSGASAA